MVTESKGIPMEVTVDDEVDETSVDIGVSEPSQEVSEPSQEEVRFTKEQVEEIANQRLSKLQSKVDSRIAELDKERKRIEVNLQAERVRLESAERAMRAAEEKAMELERKAYGDSPEGVNLFEERVKVRQERAQLEEEKRQRETEKSEHEDAIKEAKQYRTQKLADEIAADPNHPVDASLLVTLTDGSREAMERLAKVLPTNTREDKVPNLTKPPKPDSGKSTKFPTNPSMEQLDKMSMEQYYEYVKERDKKKT